MPRSLAVVVDRAVVDEADRVRDRGGVGGKVLHDVEDLVERVGVRADIPRANGDDGDVGLDAVVLDEVAHAVANVDLNVDRVGLLEKLVDDIGALELQSGLATGCGLFVSGDICPCFRLCPRRCILLLVERIVVRNLGLACSL